MYQGLGSLRWLLTTWPAQVERMLDSPQVRDCSDLGCGQPVCPPSGLLSTPPFPALTLVPRTREFLVSNAGYILLRQAVPPVCSPTGPRDGRGQLFGGRVMDLWAEVPFVCRWGPSWSRANPQIRGIRPPAWGQPCPHCHIPVQNHQESGNPKCEPDMPGGFAGFDSNLLLCNKLPPDFIMSHDFVGWECRWGSAEWFFYPMCCWCPTCSWAGGSELLLWWTCSIASPFSSV